MKCHLCDRDADYTFVWPGQSEKGICRDHKPQLVAAADRVRLFVQIIPVAQTIEAVLAEYLSG